MTAPPNRRGWVHFTVHTCTGCGRNLEFHELHDFSRDLSGDWCSSCERWMGAYVNKDKPYHGKWHPDIGEAIFGVMENKLWIKGTLVDHDTNFLELWEHKTYF